MSRTGNCEIRHLNAAARDFLATILDACDGWRRLASVITKSPTNSEPLYNDGHLKVLAGGKRSPTLLLFDDWGTRGPVRPTVKILCDYLVKIDQFRAAHYLATEVLKEESLERPEHGIAARIPLTHFGRGAETVIDTIPSSQDSAAATSPAPISEQEPAISDRTNGLDANYHESRNLHAAIQKSLVIRNPASDTVMPHVDFKHLFIATAGFNKTQKLGQGGFGAVFLGNLEVNGKRQNVAVKRLNVGEEEQFRTEIHVMTKYVHENLLHILAFSCDNPQARCLICAFMSNGSLEDRLAQKGSTPPLQWEVRLNIAVGTARGLVALHTMHPEPLVHRDIKSANILLDENFKAKIGDFGIARLGSGWEETTKILTSKWCGTPVYMADEALRGSITVKMDTFSFGVVLLELLTGLPPFDSDRSEPALLSYVDEEEKDIKEWKDPKAGDWPENIFVQLFELATNCTERRKKVRPLMEDILPKLEALQVI